MNNCNHHCSLLPCADPAGCARTPYRAEDFVMMSIARDSMGHSADAECAQAIQGIPQCRLAELCERGWAKDRQAQPPPQPCLPFHRTRHAGDQRLRATRRLRLYHARHHGLPQTRKRNCCRAGARDRPRHRAPRRAPAERSAGRQHRTLRRLRLRAGTQPHRSGTTCPTCSAAHCSPLWTRPRTGSRPSGC